MKKENIQTLPIFGVGGNNSIRKGDEKRISNILYIMSNKSKSASRLLIKTNI